MKINPSVPSYTVNTKQSHFSAQLYDNVMQLIKSTPVLPGSVANTSESHRGDMSKCLEALALNGEWSHQQGDTNNRNIAVGMQATIETALLNSLANDNKSHLSIIIHTNNPPTPLCADVISDSLFNSLNKNDLCVLSTVTSRVDTNKQFLEAGNQVSFCSLYGTERSSAAEQLCFEKKVSAHAGFFALQAHEEPSVSLSGATYVFTNGQGDKSTLGVRITQANVASDKCSLFVSAGKSEGHLQKYLEPLDSYIRSISDNLCVDNSVKSKTAFFELIELRRIIGR